MHKTGSKEENKANPCHSHSSQHKRQQQHDSTEYCIKAKDPACRIFSQDEDTCNTANHKSCPVICKELCPHLAVKIKSELG